MLSVKAVAELLAKWREKKKDAHDDLIELLNSAVVGSDSNEPVEEIARTICEILEPERLGDIRCMNCKRPIKDCLCYKPSQDRDEL